MSSVTVRGAKFSITKRLPSEHVERIHTETLTHVIKKIAGFETNGQKAQKEKSMALFKALLAMLTTAEGREAAKMCVIIACMRCVDHSSCLCSHAHMLETLETYSVQPSASGKLWEAQRSYAKRLNGLMVKGGSEFRTLDFLKPLTRRTVTVATKRSKRKSAAQDDDGVSGSDEPGGSDGPATKKTARQKVAKPSTAPPRRRPSRGAAAAAVDYQDDDASLHSEDEIVALQPKKSGRIKAKPVTRPAPALDESTPAPEANGDAADHEPLPTTPASRKRRRAAEDDEEAEAERERELEAARRSPTAQVGDEDEDEEEVAESLLSTQKADRPRPPESVSSQASISRLRGKKPRRR